MSSFASAASLIIATSQLKAVQAVIGAIRAADLESGDVLTPSGIIEKPEPAPTPDPETNTDTYENSAQARPSASQIKQATYAPPQRPCASAHAVTPRLKGVSTPATIPWCDVAPEPACSPTNPIEAPWKVLPWMDRPQPRIVLVKEIKLITAGSDMSGRGQMIDLVV